MNAIAKIGPQDEAIRVLQASLYPGAQRESVEMVLSYCRLQNLDPFLKPVHIVPMWDETSRSMRDVLMPGIADYRIKASRTSEYAGKSEPEFGPDITRKLGTAEVTFPAWCRLTIHRLVRGEPRAFTAKEFWLENYATAKDKITPNRMWLKRPYGQISKCTEAQCLRMAFPEFTGGHPSAEEMEGKEFEGMTIEQPAPHSQRPAPAEQLTRAMAIIEHGQPTATADAIADSIPALDQDPLADRVARAVAAFESAQSIERIEQLTQPAEALLAQVTKAKRADLRKSLDDAMTAARERFVPPDDDPFADLPMPEAA